MTVLKDEVAVESEAGVEILQGEVPRQIEALFEGLIGCLNGSKLPREWQQSVLAKVLVMHALDDVEKDEFLYRMGRVYEFEAFMKPKNGEVH